MSNRNLPPQRARNATLSEALAEGTPAAMLIATGPNECSWALMDWFRAGMTKAFADELAEQFRNALYDNIRPQG